MLPCSIVERSKTRNSFSIACARSVIGDFLTSARIAFQASATDAEGRINPAYCAVKRSIGKYGDKSITLLLSDALNSLKEILPLKSRSIESRKACICSGVISTPKS